MIASKTKFKSTGDLRSPSSSMSTITSSSVQSVNNYNNAINRPNNDGRDRNIRYRNLKQQYSYPKRPPFNPALNKTGNLKREYKIRQSQTLLLLITTTISFFLFLLFTLPFYALVGLTVMITFFGLGIVVATSAIKTRYLLELEHPLGLLRYLPQKVRVPLTEKSLHDCLISPSASLNSLKSLSGGDDSKKSSKNSLSSLGNKTSSNHSSMESLASYNNNNNENSSNSWDQSWRGSSRPSLLPPPPPPPPDRYDGELKASNSSDEFSSGEFDMVRQTTLKRDNKTSANLHQRLKSSDRYSIYQTNERVIR